MYGDQSREFIKIIGTIYLSHLDSSSWRVTPVFEGRIWHPSRSTDRNGTDLLNQCGAPKIDRWILDIKDIRDNFV